MGSRVEEITKEFPKVFGMKVTREDKEEITVKGIPLVIKRFWTDANTHGVRVPLKGNDHPFFLRFNEYLFSVQEKTSEKNLELDLIPFNAFVEVDPNLVSVFGETGFYVYKEHVVFTEEKNGVSPGERLVKFVDFYKRKFSLTGRLSRGVFDELDRLEIT